MSESVVQSSESSAAQTVNEQAAPQPQSAQDGELAIGWWERFSFNCMRRLLKMHTRAWGVNGLYKSCAMFATLEYWINYKRRRRVRRMLDVVMGGELSGAERHRLIRQHFIRQRCDKIFYLIFDMLSREEVESRFSVVNRQLLDDGLKRGNGVYVLLCHHGPHHVTGMIMSLLGYRVGGIRDPNEGAVRRYVKMLWEKKHPDLPRAKVLYAGDFVRQVYRLFKDNYALGSALDVSRRREAWQKTCPVQIFGETREFLTGTLRIALRCNAVVLQGFIVGSDDYHYRLELTGPMIDPETESKSPERIQQVMQQYADNIADYAKRYPDHVSRA